MCKESVQLQIEKSKICRRGSRCPEYAELGPFTLLFLQRTARKCIKISNARAELLFCSLNLLFGDVLVAVAVVVCLSSLFSVWGGGHQVGSYPGFRNMKRLGRFLLSPGWDEHLFFLRIWSNLWIFLFINNDRFLISVSKVEKIFNTARVW